MAYLPNRGDIVHLDFDPSSGREMKWPHFGLVLSGKLFNQQDGLSDFAGCGCRCPQLRNRGHTDGGGHRDAGRCALPSIEATGLAGAECALKGNGAAVHRR